MQLPLDDPSKIQKEEFTFEIEQMKLLGSHKNVVSMVGCCTIQEKMFLVIEYVPCGDLLTWLRRRRKRVRRWTKFNIYFKTELLWNKYRGTNSESVFVLLEIVIRLTISTWWINLDHRNSSLREIICWQRGSERSWRDHGSSKLVLKLYLTFHTSSVVKRFAILYSAFWFYDLSISWGDI